MKKSLLLMMAALAAGCIFLLFGCSSDDDEFVDNPVLDELNVLLIQSDKGKTSMGYMYKNGETYNPPHCYLGQDIRYNGGDPLTIYHMSFGANIKGSDVFDLLNITFESNRPLSLSELKAGDTFDSSQFHAAAAYTPTWTEDILIQATALSGKVTVVGTKTIEDKSYMVLRLTNLKFDAIDHSCVYTVNGTVEYERWDLRNE